MKLNLTIDGLASVTDYIQDRIYNVYISHLVTLENEMNMVELEEFRESINKQYYVFKLLYSTKVRSNL